mgnify:CR=1
MLNNRLVNLRYQDMFFRLGKNKFVESNVWEKCFWPKKQSSQFVHILQMANIQPQIRNRPHKMTQRSKR